jgi:hypothetical protein
MVPNIGSLAFRRQFSKRMGLPRGLLIPLLSLRARLRKYHR